MRGSRTFYQNGLMLVDGGGGGGGEDPNTTTMNETPLRAIMDPWLGSFVMF